MSVSLVELYNHFLSCQGVSIDSRKVQTGDMFFALQGEKVDGNQFALKAIQNGAQFAVIDDPTAKENEKFLLVTDVLTTLQELATHHRNRFSIPVIGITGSNGKTTTKELLYSVLSRAYKCHFTKGNYNNHIGVPITLLEMEEKHEVAVIEMGANHPGEIAQLCELSRPTHGIITNVGKAHLEGFGGFEGVKKTKAELYEFLSNTEGLAFINKDEPFLWDLAKALDGKRIAYGRYDSKENETWLRGECSSGEEEFLYIRFWDEMGLEHVVESKLSGQYNCPNLLTAISIGLYFKVSPDGVVEGISNYIPSENRSQIKIKDGVYFILDAYNANPSSIRVALQSLSTRKDNPKIAILGAMKELGIYAEKEHKDILEFAKSLKLDKLITVGDEFIEASKAFEIPWVKDVSELKEMKLDFPKGSVVLLKGSRSIALEKYVT